MPEDDIDNAALTVLSLEDDASTRLEFRGTRQVSIRLTNQVGPGLVEVVCDTDDAELITQIDVVIAMAYHYYISNDRNFPYPKFS